MRSTSVVVRTNNSSGSDKVPVLGRQTFQCQWLAEGDRGSNKLPPIAEDLGQIVTGPKKKGNIRSQLAQNATKNAKSQTPVKKSSPGSAKTPVSAELRRLQNTKEWERANGAETALAAPATSAALKEIANSPGWENAARNLEKRSPAKINSPRANAQLQLLEERVLSLQLAQKETAKKHAAEQRAMQKKLLEKTAAADAAVTQSSSKAAIDIAKEAKKLEKVKLFYFSS